MNTEVWLIIGICSLLLLFFIFLFLLFEDILIFINKKCNFLRYFIEKNDGLFTILFLLLFSVEQIILIFLIYINGDKINILKLIISIFALVVVVTASLQKFILEKKREYDKKIQVYGKKAIKTITNLINKLKEEK